MTDHVARLLRAKWNRAYREKLRLDPIRLARLQKQQREYARKRASPPLRGTLQRV